MKVVVVVVAAGLGERLREAGDGRPKALVSLGGVTILEHAVRGVRAAGADHVVVVHTPGHEAAFVAALDRLGEPAPDLVSGGATRTASVHAGVATVAADADVIAIHDAARALTPPHVMQRAFRAVGRDVIAAAPGTPVPDTLKRVTHGGDVHATIAREGIWAVHTPQAVQAGVLRQVLAWAGDRETTDDLALVEHAVAAGIVSGRIRLVGGDPRDLKITHPADLEVARSVLGGER